MQSSNPIRFAGDVSIEKVKIITSKGVYQNIAAQVITIQVYEDIFSPFISGSLIIKDSLDLVNTFPFIGEEFLELDIVTPSLERGNITGKFYIYKMTDREIIGDRTVAYQLHFISAEAIVDTNKKLSKVFSGKISDLVKNFVTDKVDGLESEKNVYVEPTSNNIKYISNYWSPVTNLMMLADNASNRNKVPNYVFFENRDGFYFVSLDSLYSTDVYQSFVYDKYTREIRNDGSSVKNIGEDYKRISSITIPIGFDYLDRISSGMLSSRMNTYDVTRKMYSSKIYNAFSNFARQKHLNKFPINTDSVIFRANSHMIRKNKSYGTFNGFGDVSDAPIAQERISLMKLATSNRLTITVPGRADYTVGQKVSVTLNKMQPLTKEESDITDKMFSGNYLIAAINHYVDREGHQCHMELIKESSILDMNARKT